MPRPRFTYEVPGSLAAPALEEEIRGPVHADIIWTEAAIPLAQVVANAARPEYRWKGGVYILLNGKGHVLKAGISQDFPTRAKQYLTLQHAATDPALTPHAMYLGRVIIGRGSRNFIAVGTTIERAITRTLLRLTKKLRLTAAVPNDPLPLERQRGTKSLNKVFNHIKVTRLLPPALVADLRPAYDPWPIARTATERNLYLSEGDQPRWEMWL